MPKSMKLSPTIQDVDSQKQVDLKRVQVFLEVVLAERAGPLTDIQRELLQSAATSVRRIASRVGESEYRVT